MARVYVLHLHSAAPSLPSAGAPCNGCGACCAVAPCPLGIVLSRRRTGACTALTWDSAGSRYRCGVVVDPQAHLPWLPAGLTRRLALRWIAAAAGCDATLDVV